MVLQVVVEVTKNITNYVLQSPFASTKKAKNALPRNFPAPGRLIVPVSTVFVAEVSLASVPGHLDTGGEKQWRCDTRARQLKRALLAVQLSRDLGCVVGTY